VAILKIATSDAGVLFAQEVLAAAENLFQMMVLNLQHHLRDLVRMATAQVLL